MIQVELRQTFQLNRNAPPNLFIGTFEGSWKMESRDENGVVVMKRTIDIPITDLIRMGIPISDLIRNVIPISDLNKIGRDDVRTSQSIKNQKQQWSDTKKWHKHAKHYKVK